MFRRGVEKGAVYVYLQGGKKTGKVVEKITDVSGLLTDQKKTTDAFLAYFGVD